MNIEALKYTLKHKGAFLKVEKQLIGKNTIRGYLHDLDKVFLYLLPMEKKAVHNFHRKHNKHHAESKFIKTKQDYIEMVIDWECARITKPDKPLNAEQTLYKFYPELEEYIIPILIELGLKES